MMLTRVKRFCSHFCSQFLVAVLAARGWDERNGLLFSERNHNWVCKVFMGFEAGHWLSLFTGVRSCSCDASMAALLFALWCGVLLKVVGIAIYRFTRLKAVLGLVSFPSSPCPPQLPFRHVVCSLMSALNRCNPPVLLSAGSVCFSCLAFFSVKHWFCWRE